MIKAKTSNGDLLLGLSDENINRLKKGEPIKFRLSEVFPELNGDCLIFSGRTELDMMKSLPLGPNTKINL